MLIPVPEALIQKHIYSFMADQEAHNRYDQEEEPQLYRAFQNGWEAAPEVKDIHIDVEDSPEGAAFLQGVFARLSVGDFESQ